MQDQQIAKILLQKKAVMLNLKEPYKYTSGMKSPIYVDNRLLISYPTDREVIVTKLRGLINKFSDSKELVLAGTATAAIPWAAFMAKEMNLPMTYVRPKPKGYGADKQVEGDIKKGSDVVVVEDLISTAGSSIGSVQALKKEYDANVLGVVAIYTHSLKAAKENFEKEEIKYDYLTDFETVVNMAKEIDYINDEEKEKILKWRELGWDWAKEVGIE